MKDFKDMEYHPASEQLVKIMMERSRNDDPSFFRIQVAYYWGVVASMMRGHFDTLDVGVLPINIYAIALSASGSGKGVATNMMKDEVINQFRSNFMVKTFPAMANINLPKLANARARANGTDPDVELQAYESEFASTGPYYWSFPSATPAAIQEIRHKLLLADGGALNLQVDEIGRNLHKIETALNDYLLLYDVGSMDPNLIKGNKDNLRREEIVGNTPANLMGFGAPEAALDDGPVQELFEKLWATGYGRRPFFCLNEDHVFKGTLNPSETYDQNMNRKIDPFLEQFSDQLGDMADIHYANKTLIMERPVRELFIEYEQMCHREIKTLSKSEKIREAEVQHRYFKAQKLAAAYSWIDGEDTVTEKNAYAAIRIAEDSGEAFARITKKDKKHVKLSKHLAAIKNPMTHSEIIDDLPFYRGSERARQEMITLAIDYGYKNNILIKRDIISGIEFFTGSTLEETDLDLMICSYAQANGKDTSHLAHGYTKAMGKWDDLVNLVTLPGAHWCSHGFTDKHRCEDKAVPGFNLLVLDVDKDVQLSTAKMLLEGYKALFYTTKSHTEELNRFRIILPMNYVLKLDAKEHLKFWDSVYKWLPFEVDHASSTRSRKWEANNGHFEYQDGKLIDVLPFIPSTKKNEEYIERNKDMKNIAALERWFLTNIEDGSRNNMLHRYAMTLIDGGFDIGAVGEKVTELNAKLPEPLSEAEIANTVMKTAAKKIVLKVA